MVGGFNASAVIAFSPFGWLTDPFSQSITMQRALVAGVLAAIACALIGTWVVLRGMTFIGDAMAHGVVPGLAVATLLGISPVLGALGSALVMVAGITWVTKRTHLGQDTAIGLLFVGMLALGVLIVSRSSNFAGDLTGFLFGGITSVTTLDLVIAAAVAIGVLVSVVVGYRALLVLCFNSESATMFGLRPGVTHALMLVLVTATVIASFKTVGTMLVFALIIAPAATAVHLVRRVPWVLATSVVLALVAVVVGLLVSWYARLAAGAAMASCAVLMFILVLLGTEIVGLFKSRRSSEP